MAEIVTLGGVNYTIPDPGDQPNWATGLTPFLVAVAANIASTPAFMQTVAVSATPTTTVTGKTYLVNTSSLAITLNLPAPIVNEWLMVKDVSGNAATRNITLHRPGAQTIDGTAADKVLSRNFGTWILCSDGANYFVLNEFPDTGLVNADVSASAALAYSKLALTGSVVNADVSASAAIAYSKLALTGSVVNADINASAAIAVSKLAALTISKPVRSDASGLLTTGNTTLTSEVTGTLPVANGGTNSASSLTNTKMMVSAGGAIIEAAKITVTNPGTTVDTNYDVMKIASGPGGAQFVLSTYSTTAVSTAKQIGQINDYCSLFLIVGNDTVGNIFADLVLAGYGATVPTAITSKTVAGAPAVRTYSQASNNQLKVAMASGGYNVTTTQLTTTGY